MYNHELQTCGAGAHHIKTNRRLVRTIQRKVDFSVALNNFFQAKTHLFIFGLPLLKIKKILN